MFAVPWDVGEGDIVRVRRRPPWGNWRVREGWRFIPENRRWDADEREWISKAVGLHGIAPSIWAEDLPDRWWKALARAYVSGGDISFALGEVVEFEE
jgi:hypothetical protein